MRNFSKIKDNMKLYEKDLALFACKSDDAIRFSEEKSDIRNEFQRDCDKIIHSSAYTRYINKTQVYSDIENDDISKRMTHVQFVSRAARTISRALSLNEDLAEAIALGHDTGHTPYGHVGERILSELAKEKTGSEFAHNLNSVRVFTELEKNGKGTNLTLQVLDGIMCHNGEMMQLKYAPITKTKELFLKEYKSCIKDNSYIKKLIPMTMEGCVVRISDIIGYVGKDLDDAKKLGLCSEESIPSDIKEILGTSNDEIMNNIILDIIEESFNKPYIQMSDKIYKQLMALREFNFNNIYKKATTDELIKGYKEMFYLLFDVYIKALKNKDIKNDIYTVFLDKMCKEYITSNSNEQIIIDYLSGMTDNYIQSQYSKYVLRK